LAITEAPCPRRGARDHGVHASTARPGAAAERGRRYAIAMDKLDIARTLREIAGLLAIEGDSPFKVRAYENGAAAVEELQDDLGQLVEEAGLTHVRGIGAALAAQITELSTTGRSALHEKLRSRHPPGVLELMLVPGLTLKRIRALHEALGIDSVEALEQACSTGKVREVKGFGAKTESAILQGIQRYRARGDRVLLFDALELAEPLLDHVRASPAATRASLAGAVRRWQETVHEVDLVAEAKEAGPLLRHVERFPRVAKVESREADRRTLRLSGGLLAHVRAAPPAEYAAALVHDTGSARHVERLREIAAERGLALTEHGLFRGEEALSASSEAELYGHLGLPFIPPELREDEGEIEAALAGDAMTDLVSLEDIQGMVHCHTVYSDGKNTIEEMASAAEAMGMKYLTITDHSPLAHYAGGLDLDRLKLQWDEIARVQERVKVKLLRGTESDILESGALDYPDPVLEQFDVIIASVHSRMKMDEEQMTRRLVGAMRQPVFKIWGHALGRLLLRRDPFACRVEEVLDAAAESRAAIEVNGDPNRLDMEPRWLREARKRGIRFVISTDAHSVSGMHNLRFGVATARRGGLRKGEVLNTRSAEAFRQAVRPAA
jgi:DNA polymerase (family 10)